MRIVGGNHKGKALAAPKSRAIRPTSDRTREAVFNVLAHGIEDFAMKDARVCDLFAGTGALGLEALSRGARFCLFVEESAEARALIRRNVEAVGAQGVSKIWRRDATRLGRVAPMEPFDLIFADPPYGKGLGEKALASALAGGWIAQNAICILEEDANVSIADIAGLKQIDLRAYGDTQVVFLVRSGGD